MSSLHNPPFTLSEILEGLSSIEAAFFQALDAELVKIEAFFLAREAEARERSRELRLQLLELQEHRRAYYAAHGSQILPVVSRAPKRIRRALHHESTAKPNKDAEKPSQDDAQESRLHPGKIFEPDEYLHARKKLKRAVLEHYRGLEVLNNYRILNLTGFRKALKKFEKLTKIPVQAPYMSEKVEPCAFASDELVQKLLKEMENQFSARFMRGNRKPVPALVDGIVRIFQHETRAAIPGWSSLLFVYAILALPTMFALLVGVDALIWSEARINYVFIFELDIRTRVDHREYFEDLRRLGR
ncbi:hypothetical protein BV25DRAFT_1249814 [Artomyces pyxidatus]|uniref:Uncharacterized protein n=1 Tax=Artomyces pyxidatus TaxID=48021 RepID=A0ACB8TEI4_9AGAM|nr:hypothetical protein BV25DRAFT_1249814 [Artomyces pyxidatus]